MAREPNPDPAPPPPPTTNGVAANGAGSSGKAKLSRAMTKIKLGRQACAHFNVGAQQAAKRRGEAQRVEELLHQFLLGKH